MFRNINHFTFTYISKLHLCTLLSTFYPHTQAPSMHLALLFILSKGIPFLSPVFRYEYRKVYRNKYLRGGSDRWR